MKLGCDPEIFLKSGENFVSAVGLVHGNKENPWQIPGMPAGFNLQQDNVALEVGIPPATSKEEWLKYLTMVKIAAKKQLKGLSFAQESAVIFPTDQLQTAEAQHFGCEPDYNAWTLQVNPKPKAPNPDLRSAGGHVHVATAESGPLVIRCMDLFLGLPSLLHDKGGTLRRYLYGKAGAYRSKAYGVEYRTLSNYWLFKTQYILWVWEATERAIAFAQMNPTFNDKRVEEAINTGNETQAKFLMREYGVS